VLLTPWIDDLLAAVLPGNCPCGARGEPCCRRCASTLTPAPHAPPPPGIDWWDAPYAYAGVARELVARAKYRGARTALGWLGAAVVAHMPRDRGVDIVTWIPASAARVSARGIDHGAVLARAVAREMHVPVRALLRRAPGAAQTGGALVDRRRGPGLAAVRPVDGMHVLLVDDVATTGASLAVAAAALRAAGARSVGAVTATRTPGPANG
jgi:predicted amidophosphoribosyltransferase